MEIMSIESVDKNKLRKVSVGKKMTFQDRMKSLELREFEVDDLGKIGLTIQLWGKVIQVLKVDKEEDGSEYRKKYLQKARTLELEGFKESYEKIYGIITDENPAE